MSLTREAGFGAEVKRRIMLGTYALSSGLLRRLLRQGAEGAHADHRATSTAAFEQVDVLVSPTTPTTAFPIGERADDPMAMYLADLCTIPSNLAGNAGAVGALRAGPGGRPAGRPADHGAGAGRRPAATGSARRSRPRSTRAGAPAARPRPGAGAMTDRRTLVSYDEAHLALRAGDRAGDPRRAGHGIEDVLRLPDRVRAPSRTPTVCPVCLGLPGSLPVINRTAIEYTIRIGLALNCSIAAVVPVRPEELLLPGHAEELPDLPVRRAAVHRRLAGRRRSTASEVRVGIERVHLEEDTGKSLHVGGATGRIHGADYSLVDYNRAGIPLVEIVTKPVPGTGALAPVVARAYVTELRDLLRALGVSDVRMEEGSLRCDVNTSLAPPAPPPGAPGPRPRTSTRCARSSARCASRSSGRPRCSTAAAGSSRRRGTSTRTPATTTPGRSKEEAQDYRYFPEPDLVPVAPAREWVEQIRASLPELPAARRARLQEDWGLSDLDMQRCATPARSTWWPRPWPPARRRPRPATGGWASCPAGPTSPASSWPRCRSPRPRWPGSLRWSRPGRSTTLARQVLDGVLAGEGAPDDVVAARGLAVVSDDGALLAAIDEAIAAHPDVAEKVRRARRPPLAPWSAP